MKIKISIFLFLLLNNSISAQLIITPGAELYLTGNAQLTLSNTDLVNNGSFLAGNGTVSFTGNTNSSISGSQPVQFYELAINKTSFCGIGSVLIFWHIYIDKTKQHEKNINLHSTLLLPA